MTYPASDTGWRREDFRFPEINSVGGDSDKRAGTQLYFLTQITTPILVFFRFPPHLLIAYAKMPFLNPIIFVGGGEVPC